MKKEKYRAMLPNVSYETLEDDEDNFYLSSVSIEYEAMKNICRFMEEFKVALTESNMLCTCVCMQMHLSFYLGCLIVVGIGANQGKALKDDIIAVLKSHADHATQLYTRYPIHVEAETRKENLQTLREIAPSSIIVQTVRIWRVMFNSLDYYRNNAGDICPLDKFIPLLKKLVRNDIKNWKKLDLPILYGINQTVVQIGWLSAYLAHMAQVPLDNCLPYSCFGVNYYIERGADVIRWFHDKSV